MATRKDTKPKQKTTQKTKPTKLTKIQGGKLMCSGRVGNSYSTGWIHI